MLLVWAGWIVVEGSLLKLEYWQHATVHLQSSGAEGLSRAEVELVDRCRQKIPYAQVLPQLPTKMLV
jgi:hypothetical protein